MILTFVVGFVALQHLGFMILESVLWKTAIGRRVFGLSPANAEVTAPLALNQGVYNGFLAAGLAWSLVAPPALARPQQGFFLGCVLIAGVVGGLSAARSILFIQGLPALLGLVLWWLAR